MRSITEKAPPKHKAKCIDIKDLNLSIIRIFSLTNPIVAYLRLLGCAVYLQLL